jgi:hypothetical protein
VIPAGHRWINQMGTRDRQGRISWDDPHSPTNRTRWVNLALHALSWGG